MKKIDFNIADNRSLDTRYFIMTTGVAFLISLLFFFMGYSNLKRTNQRLSEKVGLKRFYDNESEKINENKILFNQKIKKIKEKWNTRVMFANRVVDMKTYPYLKWLDQFEEILPEMIQINEIYIDSLAKGDVFITVSSYSTEKLYELYRKLIGYDLVISGESENNGVFRSKMKVTLKK